jgi:restriction system protein
MPRKKKDKLPSALVIAAVIGGLLLLANLQHGASRNAGTSDAATSDAGGFLIVFVIVIIALALAIFLPRWERSTLLKNVDAITDAHINALVRQLKISTHTDPYGKPVVDRWLKELDYFVTNHVRPRLDASQQRRLDRERAAVVQRIWQRVSNAAIQTPTYLPALAVTTPAEFEVYCAETLRAYGWTVARTPMARDQGVDVIAEKNGVRVVLQCKLYSNPVGNKAVQEIAAGRAHQQAHCGAVVTNSSYTPSARELANTNGIWLLHFSDLPQLEAILRGPALQPGSVPYVSA